MSKNKSSNPNVDIIEAEDGLTAVYSADESDIKADDVTDESHQTIKIDCIDGAVASFYDWFKYMFCAISIVVLCLTFLFRLVNVEGSSMDTTLASGDKVAVTNFMYEPQDGDIIVISHGAEYVKPIIKRVIATEGQTIQLDYEHDRIIVDGIVIEEPYLDQSTFGGNFGNNEIPDVVPKGTVFVMGDNRKVSLDSRSEEIGLIETDNIIGKAQLVVWPVSEMGYLY